jgi:septum formation protein
MKQIILASASPRRRALLKLLDIEFESVATNSDESHPENESAPALVERLSRLKADAAHAQFPNALIIAADTDGELNGVILGKPLDAEHARAMLTALRENAHSVFTGITIADGDTRETELVHTRVQMRNYSDAEMDAYIATGDPFDKAAGYAIQHDFQPVARVDGCFANIMGLPLCRLYHALERHIDMPAPHVACMLHPEENCSVPKLLNVDQKLEN